MSGSSEKKRDYDELVSSRILNAVSSKNITQKQIIKLCLAKGYAISQPTLSKLLSGSSMPSTYQLIQICDALELNLNEVLSLDSNVKVSITENIDLFNEKKKSFFITDATDIDFHGYVGSYYVYFYPTKNSNDDFFIPGQLKIFPDPITSKCKVELKFETGKVDINNKAIVKFYTGNATLSLAMQTIYCELKSEEIGEITYLLFQYNYIAYEQLECRLATVITASSGIKRLPTMHRLLITRKKLSDKDLYYLSGQLLLNNSEILISETAYKQFLKDKFLPDEFKTYYDVTEQNGSAFASMLAKIPYYLFNESILNDSFISSDAKTRVICLLRKYSSAKRYNKISNKADEIIYKYLKSVSPEDDNFTNS